MKGHKFLKVTGILLIIAAVFYIIAGVFIGGLGALAAGLGAGSGLTASYYLALLVALAGGICQLIAGIVGVKHSKSSENSRKCVIWGIAVIAFTVLGAVRLPRFFDILSFRPMQIQIKCPILSDFLSALSDILDGE